MGTVLPFLSVLFVSFLVGCSNGCPREPSVYHSRVYKTPGDNGFEIKINENPEKYVPGKVYTSKFLFIK